MGITVGTDKMAIYNILSKDSYLIDYLEFLPKEIYRVKATDELLGINTSNDKLKRQIFIFNADPENTLNPAIQGVVYEVDVSVPYKESGTGDLAIEQIIALLRNVEICSCHMLELLDAPVVLPSETSLYQVGVRFICYEDVYNRKKFYDKSTNTVIESEM